jgi:hypothetical protein
MRTYNKWTEDERRYLRDNYLKESFVEIGKKLKGRSRRSVQIEAFRMGLPSKLKTRPRAFNKTHFYALDSWSSMISRCSNPNHPEWSNYGGRGIEVCERWRSCFFKFLEDMGERPLGFSIDRKDPNGNYEISNCQWIPKEHQWMTTRKCIEKGYMLPRN